MIFYFDPRGRGPDSSVRVLSRPDLAELAARLAGYGAPGEQKLDFSYGEVVAILPNHACPVVDLFDSFVVARGGVELGRWPVDARGRSG